MANPERAAENKRRMALLQAALDQLDDDKRAIFVMAELHGESVVSIAAGLGFPSTPPTRGCARPANSFAKPSSCSSDADASPFATDLQRAQP